MTGPLEGFVDPIAGGDPRTIDQMLADIQLFLDEYDHDFWESLNKTETRVLTGEQR